MNFDDSSPSRDLSGADRLRISAPRRLVRQPRPYMREGNGADSPERIIRSGGSSIPRSGSEGSLFSGLKSLFTRSTGWFGTPTRTIPEHSYGQKRDHEMDPEDPSPSRRSVKRFRKSSPEKGNSMLASSRTAAAIAARAAPSPYDPVPRSAGINLPPLPSNVSLSGRSNKRASLASSTSMPYLDPPRELLASSSPRTGMGLRRSGTVGRSMRSSRMDLASLAGDDNDLVDDADAHRSSRRRTLGGFGDSTASGSGSAWSPWSNAQVTTTPRRGSTIGLPSASPFQQSPTSARSGGLTRSSTMNNLVREPSVAASDVSMGVSRAGSLRHGSSRLRQNSSMRFGQMSDDDDRMSDVTDRSESRDWMAPTRSGLSSSMSMRNLSRSAYGPSSLAQSTTTRAVPKLQPLPSRKGPMVFAGEDKGFTRQSELHVPAPKPLRENDAERILFSLESARNKPQRIEITPGVPVGSSSRKIRAAIAVPLATAAESARKRHGSDLLFDKDISTVISPYGRRRVIDQAARDQRKERRERSRLVKEESDVSDMEVDARSRTSASEFSDDASMSDARSSRSRSGRMTRSRSRSQVSASAEPETTPRRSTRNSKKRAPSPIDEEEDNTPKPRRSSRNKGKTPEPTPVRSSRRRKQTTPIEEERTPSPPPPARPVPELTTTAPSPNANAASSSGYQVREDSEPRVRSSLRAGAERKHRAHQGAASYNSSRATSPNGGGRFSARDEDLPEMDELESAKIPVTSFAGISMPLFGGAGVGTEKKAMPASNGAPTLSSRIGAPAPAPAPQPATSLSVPAGRAPINRMGISTRPRASSPLAANSIVAEPDSPQTKKDTPAPAPTEPDAAKGIFSLSAAAPASSLTPTGSTTPASKPTGSSFFAPPAKSSNLGMGKPSAPAVTEGGMPNFFGNKSASPAPAATPAAEGGMPNFFGAKAASPAPAAAGPAAFDFGIAPKAPEKPVTSTFVIGAPSTGTTPPAGGSVFGKPAEKAAEAPKAPFSFGTPTPPAPTSDAPATEKPAFSFGAPAKAAEAPKAAFSFGAATPPAPTSNSPATEKPAFSFGSAHAPAAAPATEAPKAPFSFGSSAPAAAKPAEAPKSTFSFGGAATPPAPTTNSPATEKPAFSFGAPAAASPAADKPAETPFSFGASSASAAKPAAPFGQASGSSGFGSGFGAPSANTPPATGGFGAPAATTPPASAGGFGAPASSSSFGGFGSTPAASNGFGKATNNGDSKPAGFSFGSSAAPAAPAAASTPSFGGFGAPASSTPPAPAAGATGSFSFGKPAATGTGFGSGGSGSVTPTNSSFTFGASSAPAAAPPAANAGGGFGSGSGFGTGTGFGSGSGFGSAAPAAPAAAPSTPAFSFGSTGNASGPATPTNTTPPAGGFTFGAPAAAAAPASGSTFQFGAASSTPAAGGFSFGASAPAPAPAAAQRFGSPAPADPSGGFSLGTPTAEAPGSPGGRKIKPLRRGAVKR